VFVFVVCCVGSGLSDGLLTRSEESYRVCVRVRVCVCVQLFVVIWKPQRGGGLGPIWALASQKPNSPRTYTCKFSLSFHFLLYFRRDCNNVQTSVRAIHYTSLHIRDYSKQDCTGFVLYIRSASASNVRSVDFMMTK